MSGSGKELEQSKRVRLPTPAQLIRSDLECKTRTNLPINHCAEMLTRTLRSEDGLSAQPQPVPLKYKRNRVQSASERNELRSPISNLQRFPEPLEQV